MLVPSSLVDIPPLAATSSVALATASAHGTLTENMTLTARHEMVRVRDSSTITPRQASIQIAGTIAAARRGTTSTATTSNTTVMR